MNPLNTPQRQRLALALTVILSLLTITLVLKWLHPAGENPPSNVPSASPQAPLSIAQPKPTAPEDAAVRDFRKWIEEFKASGGDSAQIALLERGRKLAEQRRVHMARLIRENPEQALKEALSFDEYQRLPEDIRALVERPFSAKADYRYYPVCEIAGQPRPMGAPDHFAEMDLPDGSTLAAFTWGQRATVMSKRGMPVQGIMQDGIAALQDGVFRELTPAETPVAISLFGNAAPDGKTSFSSGKPITGDPVYALAGGKVVAFEDRNELLALNQELAKLDALPGPNGGSSAVFLPYLVSPSGGFNLAAAAQQAQALSYSWTTSKKKFFMIRVDFSDKVGEFVTQSAASTNLNGPVSAMFNEMSYGKAGVIATVSANVYRLPQTASYYADTSNSKYSSDPAFSSKTSELLRDARNTFRSVKSGSDSAINIGPTYNSGTGGGSGLGDYDIVGVVFASVGMKSSGGIFSGLSSVGGGDSWIQGTTDTSVYVHEIGHNYGVEHASFWKTTDGSVVGLSGTSIEYGDAFDIMGTGTVPQGHFHPQAKVLLSWFDGTQWADANASGTNAKTYRIYREDSSLTTGSTRGVRVTKSATVGSEEYYWLGYRGLFPDNPHAQRGLYLNWQRPGQTRCWLIDTTPLTDSAPPINGDKSDALLDLGRTYADTTANIFLTPVAVSGTGADQYIDVQVNIGPFPGNQSPTAATISGTTTVLARSNATFSVSATDSNGDSLAYFWDTHDGSVNNNSNTLTHSWAVSGTYALSLTVSDMKGGTATLSKTITVIDPADTWTSSSVGNTNGLGDVVYAKDRFIAVDYWGSGYVGYGNIYISWDGVTWTAAGRPPVFDCAPHLAFGNNIFVLTGGTSAVQIAYSTDGNIWNSASVPAGVTQIRELAFGNGQFLAIADGGNVLSSTNGINWSRNIVTGTPNFRHLAWDGSAWIATAMNATQTLAEVVWTSSDGVNWTQKTSLGVDTLNVFAHDGTAYVIGVGAGVRYSTDHGATWQSAQMPGTSIWTTFLITATDNGTLLCTAGMIDDLGAAHYAVLVSTDGRIWSRTAAVLGSADADAFGLAYGAGKFVTIENGGVTRSTASIYPDNTAPSVTPTLAPSSAKARQLIHFAASATDANGDPLNFTWDFGSQNPMQDGSSIVQSFSFGGTYTYTLRVSDGHGGVTTGTHSITISDPSRNFTQRSSGTTGNLNAIATNGSIAIVVGDRGTILSSSDGAVWTQRTVPPHNYSGYVPSTANTYFNGVTWDGSKFIAVGFDWNIPISAWAGIVYTSTDGIVWAESYLSNTANTQLYAVASNGQSIVAVGNSGTVLTSTSGLTPTPVAVAGSTTTFAGIAYGGGTYVLTGYSGGNGTAKIFTSTDGLSWTDRSSGAGLLYWQDLRKIAWLNDRFVASGWYSKLLSSIDLGQTFTSSRSAYEETPALAYGDNIYFAAGVDRNPNTGVETKVDVLSLNGVTWYQFPAPSLANQRNGAVFFRNTFLTVGNGGQIWQSDNLYDGFTTWQNANFPNGGITALADADADLDGVLNIIEYALNRNPNSSAGSNGPLGVGSTVFLNNRVRLHLDMPEPAPSDVNYIIQGVNDLTGTWTDLARKNGTASWQWLAGGTSQVSLGTLSGGRIPTEIGVPDSAGNAARYFLRLKVEQP